MKLVKMVSAIMLSVTMALGAAQARDLEVGFGSAAGRSGDVFDRQAWTQSFSYRPGAWDFTVGHVAKQDEVGAYGYASAQRVVEFELGNTGLTPFVGGGLMVRTNAANINDLLPQVWNASLSAGVAYGRVSVQYRHFSNLGLKSNDRGQNLVLLGLRF